MFFHVQLLEKFNDQLFLFMMIYCMSFLLLSVIRDIYFFSFPQHFGLLLVFSYYCYQLFSLNFTYIDENHLITFIKSSMTIFPFYFLIRSIIVFPLGFKYRKIKTTSFQRYYRLNFLIVFSIILTILFLYIKFENDLNKILHYSIVVLIVLFPYFNKNFIRSFIKSINQITNKLSTNLSFDQFGKISKIKNFVFSKEKLISSGIYKIIDSDYRSTIKVITAMQLAHQLAQEWNMRYAKLFTLDDYDRGQIKYNIVKKNEDGITVIDDYAVMYHFGNFSFVKDKIKRDEGANLFLVKNDLPIAKFRVNEIIADKKMELINDFDYFGNTILFNPGMKEDLGKDYFIVFDKIYSTINEKRQLELLKELEKKAPTAFFTSKNPSTTQNSLTFYLTSNTNVKNRDNLIICSSEKILMIPQLILLSKKVHTFFKYALLASLIIQIFLFVFAILNFEKLILIMGIQLSLSLIVEAITLYFRKKMIYLPDQPANLAHNHHAA